MKALHIGISVAALLVSAAAEAKPPGARSAVEEGGYNVGTMTVPAAMNPTGRPIQLFYPTEEECAEPTSYTVAVPAVPGDTFQVSSPLCAVEDALPLGGPFPLFLWAHGGGAGQDRERVGQLPVFEALASHGFVVAAALYGAEPVGKVRDLGIVINFMRYDSPLAASIDRDRVGVGGHSAGGGAALGLLGGVALSGIEPNTPDVKAMVLYEPGFNLTTPEDRSRIAVPYLLMNGNQVSQAPAWDAMFSSTALAVPRYHVLTDGAVHFSYETNLCPATNEARDQAIAALGPDVEPLLTNITSNAAAAFAYSRWNTNLGATTIGFGGGRNFCNRVGVLLPPDENGHCSTTSVDANGDCFTDTPPFKPGGVPPPLGDAMVFAPAVPGEVMNKILVHYTVAFLKVYVAGENGYHGDLAPGQAAQMGPHHVTIIDE